MKWRVSQNKLSPKRMTLLVSIALPILRSRGESKWENEVLKRVQDIPFEANRIHPDLNLFLGNYHSSLQFHHLQKRNITHIVSVILAVPSPPTISQFRDNFHYLVIKALDRPSQNLIEQFDEAHEFIDNGLAAGGGVLIHCMAGVSRSSTIALSYLMKKFNMDSKKALRHVKSIRSIVEPNEGFQKQLQHYEKILKEKDLNKTGVISETTEYIPEQYPRIPFMTIVMNCPRKEECQYLKGNFVLDQIEGMIVYLKSQIERIEDKLISLIVPNGH